MDYFPSSPSLKPSLAVAAALASFAFGARTACAQALTLLRPATGTTIYESSEHGGPYSAAGAFDGTPTAGSTAALGNGFAANGDNGDHNPILAFDLGSVQAVGGFGYSQFNGNGNDTLDLVGTINVFSLTQAQYTAYTAGLVASGSQPPAGGVNLAAPASFTGELTISPSQAANDNYNFYSFANAATLNGEYYAVQFLGVAGPNGGPQNPGATEFELTAAAVPEPSTVVALGFAFCATAFCVRRRLVA